MNRIEDIAKPMEKYVQYLLHIILFHSFNPYGHNVLTVIYSHIYNNFRVQLFAGFRFRITAQN